MHRRLHISLERLKKLVRSIVDAPASLAGTTHAHCDDCVTANAKRLPHSGEKYKPSYLGKDVHMEIVGPLMASHIHGCKYTLVLVDDHSRFKSVYMLKRPSRTPSSRRGSSSLLYVQPSPPTPTPPPPSSALSALR